MKLQVLNKEGKETGREVELPNEIFGIEPNEHALYLDIKRIRNLFHTGNHKAKERAEIKGSTKKLRRQKGTGAARVGSIKSPIFRGGGRVFGPRKRSYEIKVNRKVRNLAKKSALSYKAKNENVLIVEDMKMEAPKTKEFLGLLQALKVEKDKSLFVTSKEADINTSLSLRNIPNVQDCESRFLNTYMVTNAGKLIISESAVNEIVEQFKSA